MKPFQNQVRLLATLLLFVPATVPAQYTYTTNNNTITITGYTGAGGAVAIPSTINSLPVNRIGDYAFAFSAHLTSVIIPNSVTSVGQEAFEVSGLTSVTIPNSVTNIGNYAFGFCASLTNVMIGSGVATLGFGAFESCTVLGTITVDPNNAAYRSVAGVVFNKSQTALIQYPGGKKGSYVISGSVTTIGADAFGGCAGLTSVTIGNSVTNIEEEAFQKCTALTNVVIGTGVTNLALLVFDRCSRLSAITVNPSNAVYSSAAGVVFDKSRITLIQYPPGRVGSYAIPGSVTSLPQRAFYDCTGLTSVTIPASVTYIGGFYECTSLTNITVDSGNPHYGTVAGVLFDKSQTALVQYPLGRAGSYTIPDGVTTIQDSAFSFCTDLTSVTVPTSVTQIEGYAFWYSAGLTHVFFRGNAPILGTDTFGPNGYYPTVYQVPGTTGWTNPWGGCPTAAWAALWAGATDLGGGWKWLGWFGYFNTNAEPWINHQQHGWLNAVGTDTSSIWFWDPAMQGGAWWWTSETEYPYVYRSSDTSWLWYQKGSANPRWFYNLMTASWESWP